MKAIPLLIAASLLPLAAAHATPSARVSRATAKPNANTKVSFVEPPHLDVPAKPRKLVPPKIQPTAGDIALGALNAHAVVQCVVDTTGTPRDVKYVDASSAAFGRAAVAAMVHSRFSPAIKGGKAVAIQMRARIACDIPLPGRKPMNSDENYFSSSLQFLQQTANFPAFSNSGPFTQMRGAGSYP